MPVSSIVVVGSSNTDMVIKTERFPAPGETILGGNFFLFPGGKGANQAVAAARLGARVTLIVRVGNDMFGTKAIQQFKEENINTKHVIRDDIHPTGTALITVDGNGENTIVVAQGANARLAPADVVSAEAVFRKMNVLLLQLEIPIETVMKAAELGKTFGKKVILNPAPFAELPESILSDLFLITPNRKEAELLTGVSCSNIRGAERAGHLLKERGALNVLITMGSEGCVLMDQSGVTTHIPARPVTAIDTTAAGDVFNGALAVALSEGNSLIESVDFASAAAAISVTRMGAQSSAPHRSELKFETN